MPFESLLAQPIHFWVLATLGVYLTGISKSGFAGGPGVLAMPIMALVIDPRVAAATLLPLLIFMDMLNVRIYRQKFSASLLRPLVIGSLAGITAGALCFTLFTALYIKLMVGCIALGFGLYNLASRSIVQASAELSHQPAITAIMGSLSGFTSFIAHAGAPPISGYLLRLNIDKATYLGTATLFFALVNLVKLPAYAAVGQFSADIGILTLLLAPFAWFGVLTGVRVKDKIPDRAFRKVMNYTLLILGCYLVLHSGWVLFFAGNG